MVYRRYSSKPRGYWRARGAMGFRRGKGRSYGGKGRYTKNKTNVRTYQYKIRQQLIITGDGSGSSSFALMMNYPMWMFDPGSGFSVLPADVNPSYLRASDLYSEYRVTGMALEWAPRYTEVSAGAPVGGNVSWLAVDPRAANAYPDVEEAVNSPGFKQFQTVKPFRTYLKNTWCRGWFYTGADPTDAMSTGTLVPTNPLGSVGIQHYGPITSTTLGQWMITYYVIFRGIDSSQVQPPSEEEKKVENTTEERSDEFEDEDDFPGPTNPKEEKKEEKGELPQGAAAHVKALRAKGKSFMKEKALQAQIKKVEAARAMVKVPLSAGSAAAVAAAQQAAVPMPKLERGVSKMKL